MILSLVPLSILTREYLDSFEKETGEKIISFKNINEAASVLPEAEIMILFGRIDKNLLKTCLNLKWLFSLSAGVDNLPFKELIEMGVTVTNTRGIHGKQISEHVMGMILSFNRNLLQSRKFQLQKKWEQFVPVDELNGKTLCVIGAGSIGREIARKARAFDMRTIGIKRHQETLEYFDNVWGRDKLHEALGQADFVVLITPLTEKSYHLMGMEEFKSMKKNGIFINVSRGDTVDENALIEALQKGMIAGAGLDVFHIEPLPPESPFWEMENVLITPHNAGISPNYIEKTFKIFRESLLLFRQGKPLPNPVELTRQY